MNKRMSLIRDPDGTARPDKDFRFVPLMTMAEYLQIDRTTLYRQTVKGMYTRGIKKIGGRTYYQPRIIVQEVAGV